MTRTGSGGVTGQQVTDCDGGGVGTGVAAVAGDDDGGGVGTGFAGDCDAGGVGVT